MIEKPSTENQNVEFKETWHDEYLKWICGFANAQGGTLWVGLRDDGMPVGVPDSKRLMEELPNKILDVLGLVADISLVPMDGKDVIRIGVAPSSFPVSCRGEYHTRSGSTKQLLTGNALTQFLLRKTGLSWDGAETSFSDVENLPNTPFQIFRNKSVERGRMTKEAVGAGNRELLERLHLFSQSGTLTRAGVLLFHDDPRRFVFGSVVRIGYFDGAELLYQDEIGGSLLEQAERVPDLLFTKYLKMRISYSGVRRVETYPFPYDGVREAILNAIVHKAYHDKTHTQIRVSDTELRISNAAVLPANWEASTLLEPHTSHAYNPLIADTFFKAGYIEAWGRGIQRIVEACAANGNPPPTYGYDGTMLTVVFRAADQGAPKAQQGAPKTQHGAPKTEQGAEKVVSGMDSTNDVAEKTSVSLQDDKKVAEKNALSLQDNGKVADIPLMPLTDEDAIKRLKNSVPFSNLRKDAQGNLVLVLKALVSEANATAETIANSVSLSVRTVNGAISFLTKAGIIRRIGPDKGGHWEVVELEQPQGSKNP